MAKKPDPTGPKSRKELTRQKGSIKSPHKANQKHVSLASIIFFLIFLYFLATALANRGGN